MKMHTRDIRPGDVIYFLGTTPHLVAEIEPYEGPHDFILGTARAADGWGISLEDGAFLDVFRAPATQGCRDCGKSFPYDLDADLCPACRKPAGLAGLRATFWNETRSTWVSLYDGDAAQLDTYDGRWQVVCEKHSTLLGVETLRLARDDARRDPAEFCETCREGAVA